MSHVFISYVRDNSAIVDRLTRDLRQSGVTVWLDRDAIQPGTRWNEAIESSIRGGAFFIACYSSEYLGRKTTYMDQELALAKWVLSQQGVPHNWFLPLLLTKCKPSALGLTTDKQLRTIQLVDMTDDWQDGLRRILSVVEPERSYGRCRSTPNVGQTPTGTTPLDRRVAQLAIDFGTSFSMASYYVPNVGWQAVRDEQGRALQPSVIAFTDNWDYFAGWDALSAAQHRPERAIFNIKRHLGKDQDFCVGHKRFDPVTTASLMLRYLHDCAEHSLGYPVRDVLVSRPADYSARQTEALAEACARAGLNIQRILAEPVAAALVAADWANGKKLQGPIHPSVAVVVIDVGGGTTDVSVVEIANVDGDAQVEVLAVGGDNELGGMDYDEAVFATLRSQFIDPRIQSGMSWNEVNDYRLRVESSRGKAALAQSEEFRLTLSDIEIEPGTLGSIELKLDRHAFRASVKLLDTRLSSLINAVVEQSRVGTLNAVLLAGQGARIFTIAEYLRKRFKSLEIVSDFQENAVARGLSSQVGVLTGHRKDLLLLDVVCRPILVRVMKILARREKETEEKNAQDHDAEVSTTLRENQQLYMMLEVNTLIPWKCNRSFRAVNSGDLVLEIVEGNRMGTLATHTLASLTVSSIVAGDEFELSIDIDANAKFDFAVLHRKTGTKLAEASYSYFGSTS